MAAYLRRPGSTSLAAATYTATTVSSKLAESSTETLKHKGSWGRQSNSLRDVFFPILGTVLWQRGIKVAGAIKFAHQLTLN